MRQNHNKRCHNSKVRWPSPLWGGLKATKQAPCVHGINNLSHRPGSLGSDSFSGMRSFAGRYKHFLYFLLVTWPLGDAAAAKRCSWYSRAHWVGTGRSCPTFSGLLLLASHVLRGSHALKPLDFLVYGKKIWGSSSYKKDPLLGSLGLKCCGWVPIAAMNRTVSESGSLRRGWRRIRSSWLEVEAEAVSRCLQLEAVAGMGSGSQLGRPGCVPESQGRGNLGQSCDGQGVSAEALTGYTITLPPSDCVWRCGELCCLQSVSLHMACCQIRFDLFKLRDSTVKGDTQWSRTLVSLLPSKVPSDPILSSVGWFCAICLGGLPSLPCPLRSSGLAHCLVSFRAGRVQLGSSAIPCSYPRHRLRITTSTPTASYKHH